MKPLYLSLCLLVTALAVTLPASAQTNTQLATESGAALAADTSGVQLTPDDLAKLNTGVDALVPLVPAQYKPTVLRVIAVLGLLAMLGRIYTGYRTNGIPGALAGLFGGTNTPKTPAPPFPLKGATGLTSNASRAGPLLSVFLLAGILSGAVTARSQSNTLTAFPDFPTNGVTALQTATNNSLLDEAKVALYDGYIALRDQSFANGITVLPFYIYHDGDMGGGMAFGPITTNGLSYGFAVAGINESSIVGGKKVSQFTFYEASVSIHYTGTVSIPLLGQGNYYAETGIALDLRNPTANQYSESSAGIEKTWAINDNDFLTVGGGVLYFSKWSDPGYIGFVAFTSKLHGKYLFGLL